VYLQESLIQRGAVLHLGVREESLLPEHSREEEEITRTEERRNEKRNRVFQRSDTLRVIFVFAWTEKI